MDSVGSFHSSLEIKQTGISYLAALWITPAFGLLQYMRSTTKLVWCELLMIISALLPEPDAKITICFIPEIKDDFLYAYNLQL